jgi:lipid-A-disaccharide synthase-like uncharacterized protein
MDAVSNYLRELFAGKDVLWLILGFSGQALFFSRFLVQWLASEARKASVIPVSFWYLSIGGSVLLLSYFVYRRDPVGIVAYLPNCVIYIRNLQLIARRGGSLSPFAIPGNESGTAGK